jgi:hypothetical protein
MNNLLEELEKILVLETLKNMITVPADESTVKRINAFLYKKLCILFIKCYFKFCQMFYIAA